MLNELRDKIDRVGYAFFVDIEYEEKNTDLCHICKALGKSNIDTRRMNDKEEKDSIRHT